MFFGSDYGSERTCCLNGIDPQAYLRHILCVLLKWLMAVKRDFTYSCIKQDFTTSQHFL
ncbi:TPA: transposase domain-containing protein [Escherichia coli]|uniref:Transposase domain-containing protein n=1 Tax=Escherichia coli TaxID=562 RepID=A0A4D9WQA3_ECOLX|nr:transposase domain-containing protein [Escherichia coli]HAI7503691.1 transposase domain-containing protein [Escherichia coli O25b:H4-ST131]EEW2376630.1 transposase domain-containing protein [Escherichia coli]EEW2570906.1 transposase domain-containing protein [Escherichia coli]EFA4682364.1 transposase domain-containing protein [Escherichia coli]